MWSVWVSRMSNLVVKRSNQVATGQQSRANDMPTLPEYEIADSNSGRFRGGAPGARPPPRPKIFSISCSFSRNLAKSYVGALRRVGAPFYGESWIRPCLNHPEVLKFCSMNYPICNAITFWSLARSNLPMFDFRCISTCNLARSIIRHLTWKLSSQGACGYSFCGFWGLFPFKLTQYELKYDHYKFISHK